MLQPLSLLERLQELAQANAAGLLTDDDMSAARRQLVVELASPSAVAETDVPPEDGSRRLLESTAALRSCGHAEDPDDVVPLPFAPKNTSAAKADAELQEFYNREMLEVLEVYPALPLRDRKREVLRRWELRKQVQALRAESQRVVSVTKSAVRAVTGESVGVTGRPRPRSPTAAALRGHIKPEEIRRLEARVSELLAAVTAEHDAAVSRPVAAAGAELIGGEPVRMYERKPHLFRILRTAEVATVDAFRVHTLARHMSALLYTRAKLRRCVHASRTLDANGDVGAVSLSPAQHRAAPSPPSPTRSRPAPPPAPVHAAWRKFMRAAAGELSEKEISLVSRDTLDSLLDHFGKALTSTESHWVRLHWQSLQRAAAEADRATSPARARSPPSPEPIAGPLTARLGVVREIAAVRHALEEREHAREAEARVRAGYEEALMSALGDAARFAALRKATDDARAEEVARIVREDCDRSAAAERGKLEATIEELRGELLQWRAGAQLSEERTRAALETAKNCAEEQARAEVNVEFQREFGELREIRGACERELALLRRSTTECADQNVRLSTELQSTFGDRLIADLRASVRADLERVFEDRDRARASELAATRVELEKTKAELRQSQRLDRHRAQLYDDCVTEMREMTLMADQREALQARIGAIQNRMSSINHAPLSPAPEDTAKDGRISPARIGAPNAL